MPSIFHSRKRQFMKLEHKNAPLASKEKYRQRLLKFGILGFMLLAFSLFLGTVGYLYFGLKNNNGCSESSPASWVDAFLCASMILTGMGPTGEMPTDGGKIFSAFYAIYSGVTFLSIMAIVFTPVLHRFLHLMHADTED
jgi:hypothetical protein